ncbi:MAG: hypothetical protein HYR55_15735 [Acidobacteria bacterium]|nr:hypothetical protein [Acidobacteriota bacterium]MBI3655951.1 hypothetical protein [Acidobacteriota bacterium]
MKLNIELVKGLWENARDSMFHALEHISELGSTDENKIHHRKWIILSAHLAAECFLKILLKSLDPSESQFKDSKGRTWFPSLSETLLAIRKFEQSGELKQSEQKLLDLLEKLNKVRNEIIHRDLPNDIDPSVAAWSILAMLRAFSSRIGVATREIFDQVPPIETDIVNLIRWHKLGEYQAFVEQSLREDYPNIPFFPQCPNCGTMAILNDSCESCFVEISRVECRNCMEEYYIFSDQKHRLFFGNVCPNCGVSPTKD